MTSRARGRGSARAVRALRVAPRSPILLAPLLLLALGCGAGEPSLEAPTLQRAGEVAGVALAAVEHPSLAGAEPSAVGQLAAARQRLSKALDDGEPATLAVRFGELAALYQAYGMNAPAMACYANAEALAPTTPRWPYLAGVLAAERGDPAAAAAAFERALALRPNDGAALLRAGESYLRLGRLAAAAERFRGASAADEELQPAARFGLGRVLAAEGDPAGAARELEAVLAARPAAGAARYPLALAYRALGRLDAARDQLAKPSAGGVSFPDPEYDAMRAAAEGAAAHMRRGGEALVAGRLDEAVAAYRSAVEAAPDDAEARRNLALALARNGEVEAALSELRSGLERAPEDLWLRFDLGSTLSASGRTEEALEHLEAVVASAPDFTAGRFNLANALIRAGRWGDALRQLREVVRLDPHHTNGRYLLAMSLQQQGQGAEAERRLRELLATEPDHLPSLQGLAAILVHRGDAGGAAALYREALERGASGRLAAEVNLALAELAKRRSRPDEERAAYRAAIEADPEFSQARLAWAAELVRQERWREAAEQFAAAARVEAAAPRARAGVSGSTAAPGGAYLGAGQAWAAAGEWRRAREALEAGLRLDPNDLALTHALARLFAASPDGSVRDGARAMELASRAYQLEANVPHAETVAMAMAENGDFEAADEWLTSLLRRVEESGGARFAEVARQLREDRARYRRGEPVRRAVLW